MAELKIRKLETDDMFLLSAIFDKMELDIDIGAIVGGKKGKGAAEAVGREVFGKVIIQALGRLHRAKDEVKELIAGVSGLTVEEVGKLPPKALLDAVKQVLAQEGVTDFLSSTSE